ncbi:heterokaryon incompatibility protein-domain-containing protein [Schizothecium vesticola]|uniref:Heterokaryon incompatibility protein-domain-containing protein n=1 Tax=Schizothecium vesticola TaxID=314040 RepID=A0AA40KA79_9PEZI|nr:heterokaryon incompatibility protein-domain-containing protein [Schizothecium vesticola]
MAFPQSKESPGGGFDRSTTAYELCSRCKELNITPESFNVAAHRGHNRPNLEKNASSESCWLASGKVPTRYVISESGGTSSDCKLCNLIRDTIGSSRNTGKVAEYFVAWDLDGPYVKDLSKFVNTSRRLRVSWSREMGALSEKGVRVEEEVFLLPAADALSPPQQTGTSAPDLNRSLRLILKWLHMCETKHQNQQKDKKQTRDASQAKDENETKHENPLPLPQREWEHRFRDLVNSTYFGVIDVVDKQLCRLPMAENGKPAPYVALSYVWGQDDAHRELRTTCENGLLRTEPEGLAQVWERLPTTIRDALKLVQDLSRMRAEQDGEASPMPPPLRYIWIDSLCIVQDGPQSWKYNARRMDLIYGNAYFTICAADGPSSATGLVAMNPTAHNQPGVAQITPKVAVRVSMSSDSVIDASEWNHRGWTFQERILSRRCIIFAEGRIFFQCRQTNWSQDDNPDEAENGMASAWGHLLHRRYDELESRPIKFFMTAVEKYTGRNLSFASDILDAFSGVSQLMKWYLCSHLHFGLPASHFDLALLWKPLAGKCRRTSANIPANERGHGRHDLEFPSWSWCGWMDSKDPGKGARAVYDSEFLGGFIDDAGTRDWLLNHTWIIWFVRDQEANLRPLWEGPTVPPSSRGKVTPQWQGYKSRPRGQSSCWVKHLDVPENTAVGDGVDAYGRPVKGRWWSGLARETQHNHFTQRLPDTLFGVRGPCLPEATRKSYMYFNAHDSHSGAPSSNPGSMSFAEAGLDHQPYQPLLQFWTLTCQFGMVPDFDTPAADHLQRYHVADSAGDKCGTVVTDKSWVEQKKPFCTFIALSEAKDFTEQEWSARSRTHYNPGAREDSKWPLFYAMAITKDVKRGVWERLGLGKVYQSAFQRDGCRWDEIILG